MADHGQGINTRFKKGRKKTGGRKKGTPNKYSYQDFLACLKRMELREKKSLYEEIAKDAIRGDSKARELIIKRLLPEKVTFEGILGTLDIDKDREHAEAVRQMLLKRLQDSE